MSHYSGTGAAARPTRSTGGMIFPSAVMLIAGVFQVLMGIVALADRAFFLRVRSSYTYRYSVHSWGWVHVIVGAVVILAGLALLTGSRQARAVAVAVAAIAAISNFFFIPYYPIWTVLIIALDIFAIWEMANSRQQQQQQQQLNAESRMATMEPPRMEAPRMETGERWAATNQSGYAATSHGYGASGEQGMNQPASGARAADMSGQAHGDAQREQQSSSGRPPGS